MGRPWRTSTPRLLMPTVNSAGDGGERRAFPVPGSAVPADMDLELAATGDTKHGPLKSRENKRWNYSSESV
jgi:hypothetical protein